MKASRLQQLAQRGQSVWIDWLSRDLLDSGTLERLISEHAVAGVTTNPTILECSIAAGGYERRPSSLEQFGLRPQEIVEEIAATDVIEAAVRLLPVWQSTRGVDGYVSWEVDPAFAWDARKTVSEVERLRRRIDLPNVLIKIPATEQGLVAIEDSLAAGYSVNATLIFSVERYAAVAESYLRGLRRAADNGADLANIHSVASFFVSRLDTAADRLLDSQNSSLALTRRGNLGIASAKLAYRHFKAVFRGRRWEALRTRGATPQRLLWASTATKDPSYGDVRYVEELIGPGTVTTLTETTLEAFADHGRVASTLLRDVEQAALLVADLAALGIDVTELATQLENAGVGKFRQSAAAAVNAIQAAVARPLAA
jgi:transaldolase